jgi:hypothetical protein
MLLRGWRSGIFRGPVSTGGWEGWGGSGAGTIPRLHSEGVFRFTEALRILVSFSIHVLFVTLTEGSTNPLIPLLHFRPLSVSPPHPDVETDGLVCSTRV